MEQLAKPRHGREDQKLSERGVKESNLLSLTKKRYLGFARHDAVYEGIFLGYTGRILPATRNAMPITIRKNEKNWPRVKRPISSASGSRKYSSTIRKIA